MDTCRRCGTVLPTGEVGGPYCPNCGDLARDHTLAVSQPSQTAGGPAPTQAFATVPGEGHGQPPYAASPYDGAEYQDSIYGESATRAYSAAHPGYAEQGFADEGYAEQGYSHQAYPQGGYAEPGQAPQAYPAQQTQPVQQAPIPQQSALGEEYDAFFRPEPGQPSPHSMTQVMPPVAPAAFGSEVPQQYGGYGPPPQPAYDQPIDYQAAPGPYPEPYAGGYPAEYGDAGGPLARSSRSAKIGVGVAAAAILVIVVSLITLGGGKGSPSAAAPTNAPTQDVTPAPSQLPTTDQPTSDLSTSATPSVSHIPGALQFGDTGATVKWLQTRLHQLGLYNGPISGKFDQATVTAVEAFQQRSHAADPPGVVGRSTKTALIAWGSRPRLTVVGALGGDKHSKVNPEDVKRLQRALASALNQDIKASGTFDAATFGAVVAYQGSVGLPPDGVAGDQVWAALQSGRISG
jgi:peptidoglycan hydrolase-like protein with peptidoglycan-binding domain